MTRSDIETIGRCHDIPAEHFDALVKLAIEGRVRDRRFAQQLKKRNYERACVDIMHLFMKELQCTGA